MPADVWAHALAWANLHASDPLTAEQQTAVALVYVRRSNRFQLRVGLYEINRDGRRQPVNDF